MGVNRDSCIFQFPTRRTISQEKYKNAQKRKKSGFKLFFFSLLKAILALLQIAKFEFNAMIHYGLYHNAASCDPVITTRCRSWYNRCKRVRQLPFSWGKKHTIRSQMSQTVYQYLQFDMIRKTSRLNLCHQPLHFDRWQLLKYWPMVVKTPLSFPSLTSFYFRSFLAKTNSVWTL